jgi:hypothetical protein
VNDKQDDGQHENQMNQGSDHVKQDEGTEPYKKEQAREDEKHVTHTPILARLTPAIR